MFFSVARRLSMALFFVATLTNCGTGSRAPGAEQGPAPTVIPNLSCVEPIEKVPVTITSFQTLSGGRCYLVEEKIEIERNGTLVIQPNTKIMFGKDASLNIKGGTLLAEGTRNQSIYLTGTVETIGHWQGIVVWYVGDSSSYISNVIVENAGGAAFGKPYNFASAVTFFDERQGTNGLGLVYLNSTWITKSAGHSVYIEKDSPFGDFSNNTITESALEPLRLDINHVHRIDRTNRFENNEINRIYVDNKNIRDSNSTFISGRYWYAHTNTAYFLSEGINTAVPLQIQEGSRLLFPTNTEFTIEAEKSSLSAIGTPAQPIIFTGEQEFEGSWIGVRYTNTASAANRLENVRIEYAGAKNSQISSSIGSGLILNGKSQVSVVNTQIRYSSNHGIEVKDDAGFTMFNQNSITQNLGATGVVSVKALQNIQSNNELDGNMENVFYADPPNVPVGTKIIWRDVPLPVIFKKDLSVAGILEINDGPELRFIPDAGVKVYGSESALIVKGTPSDPALFTVQFDPNSFSSYWRGISFKGSTSSQNLIDNAIVEYGGLAIGDNKKANISVQEGSRLKISNTLIRDSNQYGIWQDTDLPAGSLNIEAGTVVFDRNFSGDINPLF